MTYFHHHQKRWATMAAVALTLWFVAACGGTSDGGTTSAADDDDRLADEPTSSENPAAPSDDPAASGNATSLSLAGTWVLAALTIDDQTVPLPDRELQVTIAEGVIDGDGGCNRFSGAIDRGDNGSLTLGPLAQTERACDLLDFEVTYMAALTNTTRWEGTPEGIAFSSDTTRAVYRPVEAAPTATAPLTGTRWELTSVFGPGDGPARAVSSIDTAAPGVALYIEGNTVTLQSVPCTDAVFEIEYTEENGGGRLAVNGGGSFQCEGSEGQNPNHDIASTALVSATGYMLNADRLILLGDEGELVEFVGQPNPSGE